MLVSLCNTTAKILTVKKTMKVHTNNILKTAAIAFAGTLLAATPSFAASIQNGNFESNTIVPPNTIENFNFGTQDGFAYLGTGANVISNWNVIPSAGNVDGGVTYLGNQIFNNTGALSRTVQLNGQSARGGISTQVTGLSQGDSIDVSFDLSGNINQFEVDRGTATIPLITVSLQNGGSADLGFNALPSFSEPGVFGAARNLSFVRFVQTFLYTGTANSATLSFLSRSGTNLGPIIDNVAVATATTPIPFEFSPVTGFIAGGVLFGSYKLIKRKKSVA
jgi:hypothetical protein